MTAAADPRNITPQGQEQRVAIQEMALQAAMTSGYYNPDGTPKGPTGFTAQMMDKLFHCKLPKTREEYDEYYAMMETIIAALPRIPNISGMEYRRFTRIWQDIREMSASEGMERVVASMIQQHIYELRLTVARGDVPLTGLTGVSAIITTKQQSEQTVKMPQQAEKKGGWFGFLGR